MLIEMLNNTSNKNGSIMTPAIADRRDIGGLRYVQFSKYFLLCLVFFNFELAISQTTITPPSGLNLELLEELPPDVDVADPDLTAISEGSEIVSAPTPDKGIPSCYESWDSSQWMNLDFRMNRLLSNPYRAGFGADATGGTSNIKVVNNPAATGTGTYADIVTNAVSGDYIVFDPANSQYLNSLTFNTSALPANVTVDGSMPNGGFVTLRSTHTSQTAMVRMTQGNNILANIHLHTINDTAAVQVAQGEHYWLHCFRIAGIDSSLSVGNQIENVENSADRVTISRYQVLREASKGFLILSAGASCALPDGSFDPKATGSDHAIKQRRARITIIDSELAANTRNVLNKGAYVDIVGAYIRGGFEGNITRNGGQTAIRCSYVDGRDNRFQTIRADGGGYTNGEHRTKASECPGHSSVFLDNNIYRQSDFVAESTNPRINVANSKIRTGDFGHMTDGFENWHSPASGNPIFDRPYGNLDIFCDEPEAESLSAP